MAHKQKEGGHNVTRTSKKRTHSKRVLKGFDIDKKFSFFSKILSTKLPRLKDIITIETIDYVLIIFLGVIIILGLLFISYNILIFGTKNILKPAKSNDIVMWAPPQFIVPVGVRAEGAKQLPEGCTSSQDTCWKRAIMKGLVTFVETEARVLIPGYEDREIVFAYFKNTSNVFGSSGLYNCLPVYKKDGKPVGSEIFGGVNSEIDWVYGNTKGAIFHNKSSGRCYQQYFSTKGNVWATKLTHCPNK